MKRRTIIIIFSVIATILTAECLVYVYVRSLISLFNNHLLNNLFQIGYWIVMPSFIVALFITWKKYYSSQNPAFSGTSFKIVGLFVLVYMPKIFLAAILVLNQCIVWIYKLLLLAINSARHTSDFSLNEKPFNLIPIIGLCLSVIAFVIILFGITLGRFRFRLSRINIAFEKLPNNFHGFKLIQISDLHTGSVSRNISRFIKVANTINSERPDIIFFTGDIVNEFAGELEGWENFFGLLNARYAKFSILGNHDYGDYFPWKSPEEKAANTKKIIEFETRMGFRVLLNESAQVKVDGHEITIMGVENWGLTMFRRYGRLEDALKSTNNEAFKILLSHDPSHWDAEVSGRTNIDLTLSGHTHGFQFGIRTKWFRWSPVKKLYPRWEGLHKTGAQYLYVNTGLGYIGFPGRIGIPPEIAVITLSAGSSEQ